MPTEHTQPHPRWQVALLIIAIWTVPALVWSGELHLQADEDRETGWFHDFLTVAPIWYTWAILTPFIMVLTRRIPLGLWRGAIVHLCLSPLVAGVVMAIGFGSMMAIGRWILPEDARRGPPENPRAMMLILLLTWNMVTYLVIAAIGTGLGSARRLRERSMAASRLESQLVQARLDALSSQLQPHFLFNTLNAISSLVRQQSNERAVEMIARLSHLLRHILQQSDTHEVPLEQELAFIEQYLRIEEVRFGDRLQVDVNVDDDCLRCHVPSLLLQPLVENAIRHGIEPGAPHGRICIEAHRASGRLTVIVTNDGLGIAPSTRSANEREGVGLRNTRARLTALYGAGYRFALEPGEDGGAVVRIEIPAIDETGGTTT